ncbi:MAG: membrane protein insertion efficiency factor YidD [Alphaproteobacteria bacterium]|nr:membrane protein insertion efficiency factor YidD [Alphaproteobacteria bacterium]
MTEDALEGDSHFANAAPVPPVSLPARGLLRLVKLYRFVFSPLLGRNCRYYPSCSAYAETAVTRFGALRGGLLAGLRICSCHPLSRGGVDMVPETWQNPLTALLRKMFAKTPPACDKNSCHHS